MDAESSNIRGSRWLAYLTAGVIVASLIASVVWIVKDTSPALWDIAGHQARAVIFGRYTLPPHLLSWIKLPVLYPPATYSLSGILGVLTGFPEDFPQYSLLLFAAVNSAALYGLATRLTHDRRIGFISVLLFNVAPLVAHFSRIYDLDFSLTATVTVTAYATLRSEAFQNRRWSILTGIAVAFGMLTKWTFIIYSLPFAAVLFWQAFGQLWRLRVPAPVWKNLGLAVGLVAVLCTPWYATHAVRVLKSVVGTQNNGFSVPVNHLLSWANVSYYAKQFARGITWPVAVTSLAGLILACTPTHRRRWPLVAWVVIPYLLLTFAFYSKETRYFLPSYPALAILAATALMAVQKAWLRWTAAALVCAVGLIAWTNTSWNVRILPAAVDAATRLDNTYGYSRSPVYGFTYPTQYDTHLADIAQRIVQDWHGVGQAKIIVVPNSIYLSFSPLSYETQRLGMYADYSLSGSIRSAKYEQYVAQADFIVAKTGDQGPTVFAPFLPDIETRLENPADPLLGQFTLVQTWAGNTVEPVPPRITLYERK